MLVALSWRCTGSVVATILISKVGNEYPVRIMGPNDGLVSQVGSLGSLNTLAHTANQCFPFLELSGGIINVIAWCQRIEWFIILA